MVIDDVTVVVCTLNEEKRIENCLRSIANNGIEKIILDKYR